MPVRKDKSSTPATGVFVIPGLVVLAAIAISAFMPTTRLWGINHLSYFPVWLRVMVIVAASLCFVPVVARCIYRPVALAAGVLTSAGRSGALARVVLALVGLSVFLTFPAATVLLGDGDLQSDLWGNVAKQGVPFDAYFDIVVKNIQQTLALGTNIISYFVARGTVALAPEEPVRGIVVLFALLGAILLAVVPGCVRRTDWPRPFAVLVLSALVFTGAIQLFSGYVEVYAPMAFMAVCYLIAAESSMRSGTRMWLPPLLLLVAVFLHAQALLLLPSLVMLLAGPSVLRRGALAVNRLGFVVAAVAVAGAAVLALLPQTQRFFLPLVSTDSAHGMVSPVHLLDIGNALLLIFPMGLAILGLLIAGGVRRPDAAKLEAGAEWRRGFHRVLFTAGVLFLIMFHPDLGMANDWDLYIVPTICIAVPLVAAVRHSFARLGDDAAVQLLVPVVGLSALITVSWVAINANEFAAVKRYEDVIANDKMSGAYGLEILASYYKDKEDIHAEIRALENAVTVSPNPRYRFTLGLRYYRIGEKDRAVETLRRCLVTRPEYDDARKLLTQMLYYMEHYDELLGVVAEGAKLRPRDAYYPLWAARAYVRQGNRDSAMAALQLCKTLPMTRRRAGEVEEIIKDLESAP